ncbi:hypothetical protein [Atopobacter phocae]|uniref:hypothetical protein n=1 Tax=Atopobacter phocae TaxID=136492 RepID=UPI00046F90FE|nr:hypothetical protein [Atopobacter phocae]
MEKTFKNSVSLGATICILGCALVGSKPVVADASQTVNRYETGSPLLMFKKTKLNLEKRKEKYIQRLDNFFSKTNKNWDKLDLLKLKIQHATDEKEIRFLNIAVDGLILEWKYSEIFYNGGSSNDEFLHNYRNLKAFNSSFNSYVPYEDRDFYLFYAMQRNQLDRFEEKLKSF